jgi:hypothetical protein
MRCTTVSRAVILRFPQMLDRLWHEDIDLRGVPIILGDVVK